MEKTIKKTAKNLTSKIKVSQIRPNTGRVLVSLKSWPAQTAGGVIMSEGATVIRGEHYVSEVEAVGDGVKLVSEGDIVILSMFSGYHVATTDGHAKIIHDTDILTYKKKQQMNTLNNFRPESFEPGYNYLLIKMAQKKENKTKAGIITDIDGVAPQQKNEAATTTAEVLKVGKIHEESAEKGEVPNIGDHIVIDSFIGMKLNDTDVNPKEEYKIIYAFDILGFIK